MPAGVRKSGLLALAALGLVAVVVATAFRSTGLPPAVVPDDDSDLQAQVEHLRQTTHQSVEGYRPRTTGRAGDLNVPAFDLFRQLPGVDAVEVAVRADSPARRIVHLRDWHYVPNDLFAADVQTAAGRVLTAAEVDRLYERHLLEVEAVQLEQVAVLRCLIRHHGLRRVYAEGLTPKDVPNFREQVGVQREMERQQLPRLRGQLSEVRDLLREMDAAGKAGTVNYDAARAVEVEIASLIRQHDRRLLELGSAGRLLVAGELEEVLPLDDADLLERGKPVTPDGKVRLDPERVREREDAQVRAVLSGEPAAVIVLGGAHDLSGSVRRLGGGRCEYFRVTTGAFARTAGPGVR